MRKLFILFALLICAASLHAQTSGGPNCGGVDDGNGHITSDLVNGANDWALFTPPATVGGVYTDQLGPALGGTGCPIERLTVGGGTSHYYSTEEPMSAGDSYIVVSSVAHASGGTCDNGEQCIIDKSGNMVLNGSHYPSNANSSNGEINWDASVDNKFYYACNTNALCEATITGTNSITTSVVFTFSSLSVIGIADETRVSYDGSTIALLGEHTGSSNIPIDIFAFNLNTLSVSSVFTTSTSGNCTYATHEFPIGGADNGTGTGGDGCIHKVIMSADNLLSIVFHANTDPGMTAACQTYMSGGGSCTSLLLSNGTLTDTQVATSHLDSFYTLTGGTPMYIMEGDPNPNGTTTSDPCYNHGGTTIMQEHSYTTVSCIDTTDWTGGHLSASGTGPNQPWILNSFDDVPRTSTPEVWTTCTVGSPCNGISYHAPPYNTAPATPSCSQLNTSVSVLAGSCWYPNEDSIQLLRINSVGKTSTLGIASGSLYDLAWCRSRMQNVNFWGQCRAAISRDGQYVIFSSNMAYPSGGCPLNSTSNGLACDDVYLIGPLFGSSPAVSLSPVSLSFGNQVVSTTSAQQVVTLTNTGTASLTISSVALTTGTQFALATPGSGSDCRTVGTVAVSASCNIAVTFTPTSAGAQSDTVSVTDNAAGSPHTFGVSGTGVLGASPGSALAGGVKMAGGSAMH